MHDALVPHRILGGLITAAVVVFVLWAAFGELDIVVTAHGKLAPAHSVRVSQTLEGGTLREILVSNGQAVRAGDLLVRLDATLTAEDRTGLAKEARRLKLALARIDAELAGRAASEGDTDALSQLTDAEFSVRQAALAAAKHEAEANLQRVQAEAAYAREELQRLTATLPLAQRQEQSFAELAKQGFIAEVALQDKQRDRLDRERLLVAQDGKVRSLAAEQTQAQASLQKVLLEYRRALLAEKSQTISRLHDVEAALGKASYREAATELRAPVDGTVTSLTARHAGQVVPAGTTLLEIVPRDDALVVEAWVRNEDAGFVAPGMPVKVKLAPYPFQKYGLLEGIVAWIGADSETPESMRNAAGEVLVYRVRVQLNREYLERDGKRFDARAGMQAQADILVGARTLLEFLTSPLKKTVLEAAREH